MESKCKELYLVTTPQNKDIFVVGESFDEVVDKVEKWLNENDYGWTRNRVVTMVKKIASTTVHPNDDNFNTLLICKN